MRARNFNHPLPAAAFRETDEFPIARTDKGLAYEDHVKALEETLADPQHAKDLDEANAKLKGLNPGVTTTTQVLQDLSIKYANDEFIGSRLAPEANVPITKGLSFLYWIYQKRGSFQVPVVTIGSDGTVNQVSEDVTQATGELTKRGLQEFLDSWDRDMMDSVVQDLIDPTQNVLDALALEREYRQATLMCTSSNYGSNTGSPTVTWNSATGGNPGADVDAIKSSIWRGTNQTRLVAFTSWNVHRVLKRHPVILDTFKYGGNSPMQATREMLAEYFEVDEYLVGLPQYDTANENQTASYSMLWSDVFGVVRVGRPSRRSAHFASTFVQSPTQLTWFDQAKGGKGGYFTKVADADLVKVICSDCGYLLTSVLT